MKIAYDYNVAILKRYGNVSKLTVHSVLRRKGVEYPEQKVKIERGALNQEKLLNSISRSRSKVQEYILCNPWSWFATFTVNPEKYDRYNLKAYYSSFGEWLHRINKKRKAAGKPKIVYVSIPEMHQDGAWHLHSVVEGLQEEDLERYTYETFEANGGKIPLYIKDCLDTGKPIYYWREYAELYGYVTIRPIQDKTRVASYVLKYFTKDMRKSVKELNSKLYYSSHGLLSAEEIKRGHLTSENDYVPQFENDFVRIAWYSDDVKPENLAQSICKVNYSALHNGLSINTDLYIMHERRIIRRNKSIRAAALAQVGRQIRLADYGIY